MTRLKSETLNLRVDPELKEAVGKAAADDRRSITSYIEWLIDEDLRKRASKPRGKLR